jgi:NAD+ synthase
MAITNIKERYYQFNTRAGQQFELSPWFESSLERAITVTGKAITQQLLDYRKENGVNTVVIGMSGGIDSALTAALFQSAAWKVIGVVMPIHQNPEETARGIEACSALNIEHITVDLTQPYENLIQFYQDNDVDFNKELAGDAMRKQQIRKGNIRARLRMITLYNLANKHNGIVGSTDNFSELAAGFWTLHGDVGDVAPIQSLTKSWEVPALAEHMCVPTSIITATPTDGLGIDSGDESQFGYTYAHLDLALLDMLHENNTANATPGDRKIIESVQQRIRSTAYKRVNPVNCAHPFCGDWRYQQLAQLDELLITNNT